MNGEMRRTEIINRLSGASKPISASVLAEAFGVSRQVIVQDIALLRAAGYAVTSMARGYVLRESVSFTRVFKVRHDDADVERELHLIVDAGGTVEDIFVYHKAYGTVRAPMGIKNRLQVQRFLADIASGQSSLLKNVTAGYHYHTVTAEKRETLDIIETSLRENGFLAPLQEYEPSEIKQND
ncbi:MAG: transcription repressor NadR [Clostridia bacterium]|nr:transcription repressor NadR [Clostridia bacterium]